MSREGRAFSVFGLRDAVQHSVGEWKYVCNGPCIMDTRASVVNYLPALFAGAMIYSWMRCLVRIVCLSVCFARRGVLIIELRAKLEIVFFNFDVNRDDKYT